MIDIIRFNGLKLQASRRAKATRGLTLQEAQRRVALEQGYTTWGALVLDVQCPITPINNHQEGAP